MTVPVLVLSAGATIEYASLALRRAKLQQAADAAAVAATQQLRLSNTSDAVVGSVARRTVAGVAPAPKEETTAVTATVSDNRSTVRVDIAESVRGITGKILTLPASQLHVSATARISGSSKLCLLTLDGSKNKALYLEQESVISASGCAIYSNSTNNGGLRADAYAKATASMICSAGGVSNNGAVLSPTPVTDCPVLADPLASVPRPATGYCTGHETPLTVTTSRTLLPGTYCKGLTISGTAQVTLVSGTYVMNDGPLIVSGSASLTGQNIGIYFTGNAGGMRLDPDTTINLTAPKSGGMAGILFFEDRSVSSPVAPPPGPKGSPPAPPYGSQPMRQYQITSNNAPNLLGTIYLPAGRLIIDASRPIANRSAYTVIVARQLDLNSGPNLYLNTDYGATDVPVPDGVGPKSGNISLMR